MSAGEAIGPFDEKAQKKIRKAKRKGRPGTTFVPIFQWQYLVWDQRSRLPCSCADLSCCVRYDGEELKEHDWMKKGFAYDYDFITNVRVPLYILSACTSLYIAHGAGPIKKIEGSSVNNLRGSPP